MFWPSLPEEPLTIHRFHGQTDFRSLGPECIKVIDTETVLSILHEGGALLSRWKILKSPNQCKAHSPFSFPFGFNFPVCFSQCLPLYLCLLSHLWQIHVLELSSCWCLSFVENTRVMGTDHSIERCVGGGQRGINSINIVTTGYQNGYCFPGTLRNVKESWGTGEEEQSWGGMAGLGGGDVTIQTHTWQKQTQQDLASNGMCMKSSFKLEPSDTRKQK